MGTIHIRMAAILRIRRRIRDAVHRVTAGTMTMAVAAGPAMGMGSSSSSTGITLRTASMAIAAIMVRATDTLEEDNREDIAGHAVRAARETATIIGHSMDSRKVGGTEFLWCADHRVLLILSAGFELC